MLSNKISIPLQSKVSLTLVLLISAFVLASYTILRGVIAPAFDDLELAAAKSDLHRAESALKTDLENLHALTADWAPWDDIYHFVNGDNPGFEKSNLVRPTLDNLGLDLMVIYGSDSQYLWGQILIDGEEVQVGTFNILNPDHPMSAGLTAHASASDQTLGLIQTAKGAMIVSSRPILMSDDSGPVAGAVVMGQFLNDSRLQRTRDRTEVNMSWDYVDGASDVSFESTFETTSAAIVGRKIISDIHGQAFLILSTESPRKISSLGSQTIDAATLFLIVAGILVCLFIWFMLRFTVLQPIEKLSAHIDEIRESGDLSRQLATHRSDEIGVLGRQFDSLTAEVHDARQALLEQSFKAGKADTAAEVMHNIRNAMTPMINGIDRIRSSFKVAENLRIAEAVEQIGNDECAPERKQKFLKYISASFQHVENVGKSALNDLDVVSSQARQVEGILSDQEKFANVAPVAESLVIDDLLSEAANVIPLDNPQHVEIALDDGLEKHRVRAHRIGLIQVMGNLILNAYESIKRCDKSGGRISIVAVDEIVDNQEMVRVTVSDDGSGFDAQTEPKIFQRGFTSKNEGNTTGLGLHWCANAVAGMGGKIVAESPGRGRGAEFHVLLPAAQGG